MLTIGAVPTHPALSDVPVKFHDAAILAFDPSTGGPLLSVVTQWSSKCCAALSSSGLLLVVGDIGKSSCDPLCCC